MNESIKNDFKKYKDELNLIVKQNPLECELYSIIAGILRELYKEREISVRDVSNTQKRGKVHSDFFIGDDGPPDLVLVSRNYQWSDSNTSALFGAIEVKFMHKGLPRGKILSKQMKSHLRYFKKVLYTTGLKWRYYEQKDDKIKEIWTVELGVYVDNNGICVDSIKWNESADNDWVRLMKNLLNENTFTQIDV